MEINQNAVVLASKELEIRAPLEKVWGIHADINAWPTWQPEISQTSLKSSLETGVVFNWKSGGFKLTSTVEHFCEYQSIGWTGRGVGSSAIHIWKFEPLANGNTLVRTRESMEGWLVKMLKGMLARKLNESLDTWLTALQREAE